MKAKQNESIIMNIEKSDIPSDATTTPPDEKGKKVMPIPIPPTARGYVTSSELYKIKEAQTFSEFDFKKAYSKWSIQYWIANYKLKKMKKKIFLIIMQLRNGKYDMFLVTTNLQYFEKYGNIYLIDQDMMREDTRTGMGTLYYHQEIAIPFKIDFDLDALHKKIIESKENSPIDKALNPASLKGFINSQVIEKVLKGQELSDEMKFIKILIIISLILQVIGLYMMGKSAGWF